MSLTCLFMSGACLKHALTGLDMSRKQNCMSARYLKYVVTCLDVLRTYLGMCGTYLEHVCFMFKYVWRCLHIWGHVPAIYVLDTSWHVIYIYGTCPVMFVTCLRMSQHVWTKSKTCLSKSGNAGTKWGTYSKHVWSVSSHDWKIWNRPRTFLDMYNISGCIWTCMELVYPCLEHVWTNLEPVLTYISMYRTCAGSSVLC